MSSNAAATSLLLNSMIVLRYTNTQFTVTSVPLKIEDEVWKREVNIVVGDVQLEEMLKFSAP